MEKPENSYATNCIVTKDAKEMHLAKGEGELYRSLNRNYVFCRRRYFPVELCVTVTVRKKEADISEVRSLMSAIVKLGDRKTTYPSPGRLGRIYQSLISKIIPCASLATGQFNGRLNCYLRLHVLVVLNGCCYAADRKGKIHLELLTL